MPSTGSSNPCPKCGNKSGNLLKKCASCGLLCCLKCVPGGLCPVCKKQAVEPLK